MSKYTFNHELSALLTDYADNNAFSDKVVAYFFKHNKEYTAAEKATISRNFYDILRNLRLLLATIDEEQEGLNADNVDKVINVWNVYHNHEVDAELKLKIAELTKKRVYKYSVPDWIDELGKKTFGADMWLKHLQWLSIGSKIFIRTNTLKITPKQLLANFKMENIQAKIVEDYENALEITSDSNLFSSNSFQEGFFEIQDVSSQLVSEFCDVQPGMRIADACAGAGGKTLHLSSKMQNKGKIVALDNVEWKLKEMQHRASRAGATCVEARHINTTKVIKRLAESFDRVLLDVPCTGTGIWRRNTDSKWRLKLSDFENLQKTQEDILERYSKMVKPNGKLIYSTCSIFPQEGEEQIKKFLDKNSNSWELEEEKRILPEIYDGFYMAKLKRK